MVVNTHEVEETCSLKGQFQSLLIYNQVFHALNHDIVTCVVNAVDIILGKRAAVLGLGSLLNDFLYVVKFAVFFTIL